MGTPEDPAAGGASLWQSVGNVFAGKHIAHIDTSVSFGKDQARGTGAETGSEVSLDTHSVPLFSTLTPTFGKGWAEGREGRR